MAPRKRRRACTPPTLASSSPHWALPADLVLEIVARSDAATLVRCTAACKLIRREIPRPAFLGRVCQEPDGIVPSRLLGYYNGQAADVFSPVHPATPAAASFAENILAPFVSRRAARLLEEYRPVASRGGIVLLQRRDDDDYDDNDADKRRRRPRPRLRSLRLSDLCVFDPMSGERAFLPFPPVIDAEQWHHSYALLTAADGIGCSFLLLAADMRDLCFEWCLRVQTASSDAGGEWGPVARVENPLLPYRWSVFTDRVGAVVVLAGVVHWLVSVGHYVITYDVGTAAAGWIELPAETKNSEFQRCKKRLGVSPDGRLCLFTAVRLRVSFWVLSSGGRWEKYSELDLLPAVRSLFEPSEEAHGADFFEKLELTELDQKSRVLWMSLQDCREGPLFGVELGRLVIDLDTSEIAWTGMTMLGVPYEVDLLSRLSAMKSYF